MAGRGSGDPELLPHRGARLVHPRHGVAQPGRGRLRDQPRPRLLGGPDREQHRDGSEQGDGGPRVGGGLGRRLQLHGRRAHRVRPGLGGGGNQRQPHGRLPPHALRGELLVQLRRGQHPRQRDLPHGVPQPPQRLPSQLLGDGERSSGGSHVRVLVALLRRQRPGDGGADERVGVRGPGNTLGKRRTTSGSWATTPSTGIRTPIPRCSARSCARATTTT